MSKISKKEKYAIRKALQKNKREEFQIITMVNH